MIQKVLNELTDIRRILQHRSQELVLQEKLQDLDVQRSDWEKKSALFVPSQQKLERGGRTLELGEDYEAIKELRAERERDRLRQSSLREEAAIARTELQNAGEALALIEMEHRDKLAEQTKLAGTIRRVKALDEQITDRKEAAITARAEFEASERKLRECTSKVDSSRLSLERLELALREARKFLQIHAVDEKLQAGLPGIQKCFSMYTQAEEKRLLLKAAWENSIARRQQAQKVMNDRGALFSDVMNRFVLIDKNYSKAKAFYESTLKGRSIQEWRDICEMNTAKLTELDELYKKFQDLKVLEDRLKNFQETRLRIQQETRNLNIKDIEQSGRIYELQDEVSRLERRVALLRRIEDLDAVRELLQDNTPCPLCGSMTHPYTSGMIIPDPDEMHNQLTSAQADLEELRNELSARQAKTGRLNDELSSISHDEIDLRREINELNAQITAKVSRLGLKLSAGVSPFDELDMERRKTRDTLQLARNAADSAEAAQRDMNAAKDELDKITQTREEITRFHQESIFSHQNDKSEEEHLANDVKTQEEIVNSLRRELLSQIIPFGYKSLPDRNPGEVVEALSRRLTEWQEGRVRHDELEREVSIAQTKFAGLKKERESIRLKREELASRLKGVEAERDSVLQQRIILFGSKNPDDEQDKTAQEVEALRKQLDERKEIKQDKTAKLDTIITAIHSLETQMARGREEIQKHEVNFGKKLLALGFKNEDDFTAACLTSEERRGLQNKLRELTQRDLDIKSERENTRAKLIELQGEGVAFDPDGIKTRLERVKASMTELYSQLKSENDEAGLTLYDEKIKDGLVPEIQKLALKCGISEVL
ncbi:MAG: hypothetical protein IJT58_03605 [Synergistaceae bacterium]|nr:hypothetical protein [Synergistaceae bacterium]